MVCHTNISITTKFSLFAHTISYIAFSKDPQARQRFASQLLTAHKKDRNCDYVGPDVRFLIS